MKFKWVILAVLSVIFIVSITSIIVDRTKTKQKYVGTLSLPLGTLTWRWPRNKDWKIISDTIGRHHIQIINGNILKATYPEGSYIPSSPFSGGFQFYAQPKVFPSQSIRFSYKVMFPSGFNWVKGGKLPGLWIGNMGANGGNHLQDGSSFRIMWRSGGAAEAYLYLPRQPNSTFYEQNGYVYNDQYGESLWRNQYIFQTNVWNNITLFIKVNTPNEANGIISLTINNVTQHMVGVLWIKNNKQQFVNGLMMHSFFGGNDGTWATPTQQYILFKDFQVSNKIIY